jgi:hypothetical protein
VYFTRFGMLYKEYSGNPVLEPADAMTISAIIVGLQKKSNFNFFKLNGAKTNLKNKHFMQKISKSFNCEQSRDLGGRFFFAKKFFAIFLFRLSNYCFARQRLASFLT